MEHKLPELPFPKNALEPLMSAETLEYHHGKHHKTYVETLNKLIKGTEFENLPLEEIIRKASGPIYNNAAQAWNHTFFWHCLTPNKGKPSGQLLETIEKKFGSVDEFATQFKAAGKGVFGSGWVWLTQDTASGELAIETSPNGDNPLKKNKKPILTCDVWEHAYYIDYRNERPKFLDAAFQILNWEFAAQNFTRATEFKVA